MIGGQGLLLFLCEALSVEGSPRPLDNSPQIRHKGGSSQDLVPNLDCQKSPCLIHSVPRSAFVRTLYGVPAIDRLSRLCVRSCVKSRRQLPPVMWRQLLANFALR
jgi:hypothetical protein